MPMYSHLAVSGKLRPYVVHTTPPDSVASLSQRRLRHGRELAHSGAHRSAHIDALARRPFGHALALGRSLPPDCFTALQEPWTEVHWDGQPRSLGRPSTCCEFAWLHAEREASVGCPT